MLAETEYPPSRINTLLAATGDHLTSLVAEIVRWLVAHEVEEVVLTDVITCAIADALSDAPARTLPGIEWRLNTRGPLPRAKLGGCLTIAHSRGFTMCFA